MPITRLAVETELVDRTAALMILCGKTATATGTNANLTGPIGFACQHLGVTPLTPGTVVDTDLQTFDAGQFYSICDLAEYRLIRSCLTNFVQPDQAISMGRQDLNAMMRRFQDQADALEKQYAALLNIRQSPTRVGKIRTCWPTPGRPGWALGHGRSDH